MRKKRYIVHVDMDAFFAAIEQRDNPSLSSRPVVVGADPKQGKGRGVVSACSYEARKFGIHSAMPISTAYRKCPEAVFLPVAMEKYESVSRQIYDILYSFTPDVEPVSIDEAFLDISGTYHLFGTPLATCRLMKSRIKGRTGLTASVGLAPTKMAAKIASDLKKPDGLVEVTEEGLVGFLRPLDVRRIWGLGAKAQKLLNEARIFTIGDLAKRPVQEIIEMLGKSGEGFWYLANGIDERKVETASAAKSISNEVTFQKDTLDREKISAALMHICENVSDRLRHERLKSKTITLKIRLEGFLTYTRSLTIDSPTNFADTLYMEAKTIFNKFDTKGKKVRLIGLKVSNLIASVLDTSLFRDFTKEKHEKLYEAIDKIKERFGGSSIFRAGSITQRA